MREQLMLVVGPDIGLVSGVSRDLVPERGWSSVTNSTFRLGSVHRIRGFSVDATLDSPVMGLHLFRRTDGYTALVAVTRSKVWKMDASDSVFVDITGPTALTGGPDDWAKFAVFKDVLVITNGKDPLKKWPGGAVNVSDVGGNPPKGKSIEVFQNHLVVAWTNPYTADERPHRLQWSAIGELEVWSGSDAGALILVDEPSGILEIAQMRDSLIAYKGDAVYVIDYTGFPFTMQTRRLIAGLGAISPRAVVKAPDAHYFLGPDGMVYRLTMAGPEPVGQAVQIEILESLNWRYKSRIFSFLDVSNPTAVFVIPSGGSELPNRAYIMDLKDLRWGVEEFPALCASLIDRRSSLTWDGATSNWDGVGESWDSSTYSAGAPEVVRGTNLSRVESRRGQPLTSVLETRAFDLGDPYRLKRVRRVIVHYDAPVGGSVRLFIYTSTSPNGPRTEYGPFDVALDDPSGEAWVDTDVTGRWIQLKFVVEGSAYPVRVTGYGIAFYTREVN